VSRNISTKEMSELMNKIWASTDDIKKIGCIGKNKALEIKREIQEQMREDKMVYPRNLVAMNYVIRYFHIDERKIGGLLNG